jgi:NAD+ diphosphatase
MPPVGFTGSPLDRADHLRCDPAALERLRASPAARFLAFEELRPILNGNSSLQWLKPEQIPTSAPWIFLGMQGVEPHFAVNVPSGLPLPGEPVELRAAASQLSFADAAIAGQARALLAWHSRHTHCSVCGSLTRPTKGGYQSTCESEACRAEHFPRTDPVVIMLVTDGGRCLLGRQSRFPPGYYSTLAGFVEPGESIEEAVAREVFEEAGIRVNRVSYIASQPWPFPSSLMIGCFAEAASTGITVDATELEDAKWFTRAEAQAALAGDGPFLVSPPFAISYTLLKTWAAA